MWKLAICVDVLHVLCYQRASECTIIQFFHSRFCHFHPVATFSRASCNETTSAYLASRSKRFAFCIASVRSPQASPTTCTGYQPFCCKNSDSMITHHRPKAMLHSIERCGPYTSRGTDTTNHQGVNVEHLKQVISIVCQCPSFKSLTCKSVASEVPKKALAYFFTTLVSSTLGTIPST